ncbi:ArsR/SmtB family transcription factor [Demequina lignilytica]|uniref:Helix-turn-helix domain-containing protein n=1 Tax=Demequina lignilytica TaxID=3051663 RepID=A0AB35MHT6_9MICO|nr:helix-turn-helix domain-containing protein [Demequina sp. SYSU T0a273]MDN4483292.1 helix-turn-helix domain-containing protein [Demequina sp. SYSU T0a273]
MEPELEAQLLTQERDTRLWAALSHPARRAVLEWLDVGPAAATDLAGSISARFGVRRSRASQHLRALAAAGLVRVIHDGSERWYAIADDAALPVARWLRDRGLISERAAGR